MRLFISVISHGHFGIINELDSLAALARNPNIKIILRDNIGEKALEEYCKIRNILYIKNEKPFGFAKNNNLNFSFINEAYLPSENDFFLILNPDIYMSLDNFEKFYLFLKTTKFNFVSIIQFKDMALKKIEASARYFKGPLALIIERAFNRRKVLVPKSGVISSFDWVSGSFMAIRISLYKKIDGFCEKYSMYYEDADLCLRCKLAGHNVHINTDINAVHLARYANRNFFSKAFFQSLISYIRFIIRLYRSKL